MNETNFEFIGKIRWSVIENGKVIRSGECKNTVVNVGKYALCSSMAQGPSFALDTMKVGTTNTTFTASSTDLTTPVSTSTSINISSVNNLISANTTFIFTLPYSIEEIGIFSGSTAWALANTISETVSASQALFVEWQITQT